MSYAQQQVTVQAPPAAPNAPSPAEAQLREEIRQSIQAARDAARDAARAQGQARGIGGGQVITVGPPGSPSIIVDGRSGGGRFGGGRNDGGIPPQAVDIAMGFFVMCAVIVIGWPLARAFGRRLERRGDAGVVNPAMADQLQRIEQAVEAMSIEVERISESQRYIARLQSERIPQAAERS